MWLIINIIIFLLTSAVASQCPCGYKVNTTAFNSTTSSIVTFTSALETDFLHVYTLPDYSTSTESRMAEFGWRVQTYNVSPTLARGPYGKTALKENVQVNPLRSIYDWGGQEGIHGGDPGLQITVGSKNELVEIGDSGQYMIPMGELAMIREDVLYGSFRIGIKMSKISGTCAAFFWYRDDASEIDMEFLSRQLQTSSHNTPALINLVVQTNASVANGFNAAGTSTFKVQPLTIAPTDGYHELRYDWLKESITFYIDGQPLWTIENKNSVVPNLPGHLVLNHWSNGDPNWSGGPPNQKSTITISYVKAYFNSSNATVTQEYHSSCTSSNQSCRIAEIDWNSGVSPIGPNGNTTGKTNFTSSNPGWNQSRSEGKKSDSSARVVPSFRSCLLLAMLHMAWRLRSGPF